MLSAACRRGRVDAIVQSTDKNFMVPVGGAVVAAPAEAAWQRGSGTSGTRSGTSDSGRSGGGTGGTPAAPSGNVSASICCGSGGPRTGDSDDGPSGTSASSCHAGADGSSISTDPGDNSCNVGGAGHRPSSTDVASSGAAGAQPATNGISVSSTPVDKGPETRAGDWLVRAVEKAYPGRAAMATHLDLLVTLLYWGVDGWTKVLSQREALVPVLRRALEGVAEKHGERVLVTPGNPISLAMTLDGLMGGAGAAGSRQQEGGVEASAAAASASKATATGSRRREGDGKASAAAASTSEATATALKHFAGIGEGSGSRQAAGGAQGSAAASPAATILASASISTATAAPGMAMPSNNAAEPQQADAAAKQAAANPTAPAAATAAFSAATTPPTAAVAAAAAAATQPAAAAAAATQPPPAAAAAAAAAAHRATTFFGAMLWTRGISGTRVIAPGSGKSTVVGSVAFEDYGSHCAGGYPHAYLTAAAALGATEQEVELFAARLSKALKEAAANAVQRGSAAGKCKA